ncbi:lysosome-associated membrane glycoprotein 3 [Python bivittatus]|uniref:Lysosome-associated membrane glycoprotein 3 n=1 Tax=Python bivittatus TaxID=176946 RepID=A0A9F5IC57_PYTBI|nr:lysosome-associated membrane glycoprotein 3 [Python bivittatus]
MSWWKLLIEFLLITAGVFSCTGNVLDKERPERTTLQPTSFLQRASFPYSSSPSNYQATIHPYHQPQASANQLGHGLAQLVTSAIPSVPKTKMLKAESIPLTKLQAVHRGQKIPWLLRCCLPTLQSLTVWKPIAAAGTTVLRSEPQTDWTETPKALKTRRIPQETTSELELSTSQKRITPVLVTTKGNVYKTVSRATDQHTTKLRKHTTTEKTSVAAHKDITSVQTTPPTPLTPAGPTLAFQPSPAITGAYSVSNGTTDCVKALIGLTMIVTNTKTDDLEYFNIVPNATHTTGHCGYGQSMLNISFEGGFIHFIFTKKGEIYYISMIEASLTVLSQGSVYNGIKNDQLFSTAVGKSFKCLSKQTVGLANDFQLQVANSQLQAFDIVDNQFGKEEECILDRNKRLIPATIGFSLAGLIIIILASCAIYRRKPHLGYSRI